MVFCFGCRGGGFVIGIFRYLGGGVVCKGGINDFLAVWAS